MSPTLTEPQFLILDSLRAAATPLTQRALQARTCLSLGTVNTYFR